MVCKSERQKYDKICKHERQKYDVICKDAEVKFNAVRKDAESKYNSIIKRAYELDKKYNILQSDITSLEKYEQNIRKEHHRLELNETYETFLTDKSYDKPSCQTSADKESETISHKISPHKPSNPWREAYHNKNVQCGTSSPRVLYGYMASVFREPTGL